MKDGYDKTGRASADLLDNWSVRRLKEAGADCIKFCFYTPLDSKEIMTRSMLGERLEMSAGQ